jgi:hypothetical protein
MIEAGNDDQPAIMVLVVTPQSPILGAGAARASGE